MFSVMLKLCDHAKLPKSVANSLKFQKTLGLYHGGLQCSIDQDHHLSDYNVEPLKSNVAPGKNKKQKVLRMESAILDILDNMQSNPMAEYSPRTKISLMSRMNANPVNHHADHAATLNDNNKINQLLKTGIGSMAQLIIPGSSNNNEGVSKWRLGNLLRFVADYCCSSVLCFCFVLLFCASVLCFCFVVLFVLLLLYFCTDTMHTYFCSIPRLQHHKVLISKWQQWHRNLTIKLMETTQMKAKSPR
tara:strand:- start:63 stop:800 length:738 start_codon:yes stop_codon:yes gene_type:complete